MRKANMAPAWVLFVTCLIRLTGSASAGVPHDANGDGRADILWRHISGTLVTWEMNGTSIVGATSLGSVDYAWTVVATGDFNGDDRADLLWRHSSGEIYIWLLDGGHVVGHGSLGHPSLEWTVIGTGDFNGDGRADIMWRHTSGALYQWFLNGVGVIAHGGLGTVDPEWTITGLADLTGDGRTDILWRHSSGMLYEWHLDGASVIGHGSPATVDYEWSIVGLGDFNGDARADIMWRSTAGVLYVWMMNGIAIIAHGTVSAVDSEWTIVGVGDFNGDGRDDLLWRHTQGTLYVWFMDGVGVPASGSPGDVANDWHVRPFTSVRTPIPIGGLGLGPYVNGQDPDLGATVTEAQMGERLAHVARHSTWVRFFGSTRGLEHGPRMARAAGFKVACGAWIGPDGTANNQEIAGLIASAQAGDCDLAIVGSEVLLRHDQTPAALAAYIGQVKQAIRGVPIATADVYGQFLDDANQAVLAAVDVVMPNYYPYWEGIDISHAVASVNAAHQKVVAKAGGKPVMVSESGWPSCGNAVGAAVPSPANQRAFALGLRSWAESNGVPYLYFEAYDEAWKVKNEGPQGACWGVWTAEGALKPWMEDLFTGIRVPDTWSGSQPPGGLGPPSIELTSVPPYGSSQDLHGQVWHVAPRDYVVAVYIRVGGGWWTKPTFLQPTTAILPDGRWTCDVTTGGSDPLADEIAAYLISKTYTPPQMSGQTTLPAELDSNAAAKTVVSRPAAIL